MCCLTKHSLPASSGRQLDSISCSVSPVAHVISAWFQQQKNVYKEGEKAIAERCKLEKKVIYQTAARGEERNASGAASAQVEGWSWTF